MPRNHSSSSSSSSRQTAFRAPRPLTSYHDVRPASQTGHIMPSPNQVIVQNQQTLGQSIKQGFGFGMGTHLSSWLFGPPRVEVKQITPIQAEIKTEQTNSVVKEINIPQDQRMQHQCMLEGGSEETCKQYIVD